EKPIVLIEFGRRAALFASAAVVMQRESIHPAAGFLHEHFSPFIVAPVRAARDLEDAIIAEVADVRGIALELVGIELRCHIAAATPVLVTNAEVFDFPRRLVAIFLAPICHWADPEKGDVFDPLLHLLNRAAANIAANVGLTPDLLTKIHELVCPEMI